MLIVVSKSTHPDILLLSSQNTQCFYISGQPYALSGNSLFGLYCRWEIIVYYANCPLMWWKKFIILPGQEWTLQDSIWLKFPEQFKPPGEGGGLVHLRFRDLTPPSQLFEQGFHQDQSVQPATWVPNKNKQVNLFNHNGGIPPILIFKYDYYMQINWDLYGNSLKPKWGWLETNGPFPLSTNFWIRNIH